MKKLLGRLRITRLTNIILCLIIVSIMVVPAFSLAHAQSYDDVIAQIQQVRQQLNQLMAIYNSADAATRAQMDAAVASGMQQALNQIYNSMSASDRASLEAECKRLTGYGFAQLMQTGNTVPGLVKVIDILIISLQNMSGTTIPTTVKPPTTTRPTTSIKPTTTTPTTKTSAPPESGIYIGSGKIKLGWVLYGRTDLSEEEAQAIYDGKVNERKATLDKSLATETALRDKHKRQLEAFEKAVKDKNQQALIDSMKSDLTEAKTERTQAATELGTFFLKQFASKVDALEKSMALADVGQGAYDMQSLTMKTERTREDWEKAGKGLAGVLGAVATVGGYTAVGPVAGSAELMADAIYLHLTDRRVGILENSINQTATTTENARNRYQQQIDADNARIAALQQEMSTLTTTKYLDLR